MLAWGLPPSGHDAQVARVHRRPLGRVHGVICDPDDELCGAAVRRIPLVREPLEGCPRDRRSALSCSYLFIRYIDMTMLIRRR